MNETLLFSLAGVNHGDEKDRLTRIAVYSYSTSVRQIYQFAEGQSSEEIVDAIENAAYASPASVEDDLLSA